MSFVNKIRGWGQKGNNAETDTLDHEVSPADGLHERSGSAAMPDLTLGDLEPVAAFDAHSLQSAPAGQQPSIISEVVPSEIADFSETRVQEPDPGAAAPAAALPLIGNRPVGEQRRILLAMLILGLVGLVVLTVFSLTSQPAVARARWQPAARR